MRILVLTLHIGRTAPGIVFEKLLDGLSKLHHIDVVVSEYNNSVELSNIQRILKINKKQVHPRLSKFLISVFGIDLFDCLWALKVKWHLSRNYCPDYDVVLCFISAGNYAALIAGNYLKLSYNLKLAVYSTDAIPPPLGWVKNGLFYKRLKSMIARLLSRSDAFFSPNSEMLKYQLKIFNPSSEIISDVILLPSRNEPKNFPIVRNTENIFLYTGGIYGARKADYLLDGFELLIESHVNSKLIFIGHHFSTIPTSKYKQTTIERIEFLNFTNNLDYYYSISTALIDIDADLEDDVFLSSKMPNYLAINRIIISETGMNSPSRKLFSGINSIIQCEHNPQQLCDAMKRAISECRDITFDDRKEVIELFKVDNITKKFCESLLRLSDQQ